MKLLSDEPCRQCRQKMLIQHVAMWVTVDLDLADPMNVKQIEEQPSNYNPAGEQDFVNCRNCDFLFEGYLPDALRAGQTLDEILGAPGTKEKTNAHPQPQGDPGPHAEARPGSGRSHAKGPSLKAALEEFLPSGTREIRPPPRKPMPCWEWRDLGNHRFELNVWADSPEAAENAFTAQQELMHAQNQSRIHITGPREATSQVQGGKLLHGIRAPFALY